MTTSGFRVWLVLLTALVAVGPARAAESDHVGIAVMPFDGAWADAPTGTLLAGKIAQQIASLSALRVVPPGKVGVSPGPSAGADQVRAWAASLVVDSVLLGRTFRADEGQVVEVELLSGHSGGPIAEHRAVISKDEDVSRVTQLLAAALLEDLQVPASQPLPAVDAPAPERPGPAAESSGVPNDEGELSIGMRLTTRDDPLSIDSDELELIENNDSRLFIFTRNVRVNQGDIQLTTERLEAFYEPGASQPTRLVATGDVRVIRGDRRATCDRAVYLRDDQTVVCMGRAELLQRCDRVRGPKIEFDLGRDHVRVLGGASVVIQPELADDGQGCSGEDA